MKFHKKLAVLSISAATAFGSVITALPSVVFAEEGVTAETAITKVEQGDSTNVVNLTFQNGYKGRITFLEEGIFRYNVDPEGEFSKYATGSTTAKIQVQPDESSVYSHPAANITDTTDKVIVTSGTTTIEFGKADGKMTVKSGDKIVMAESEPLSMKSSGAVQTLAANEGEDFYGGGTQNGRFVHTGEVISISNTNNWTDGGVASPNPFYWSTNGYGVLRNTFTPGSYDFGKAEDGKVSASHEEKEFDAYYFVSGSEDKADISKDLLKDYFKVTGNPVLLPEYAFYLGHLNCYNRDSWDTTGSRGWTIKGGQPSTSQGTTLYESGMASGYILPEGSHAESLNGVMPTVNADKFKAADTPREYSARAVIDRYQDNDMPFGWFLPNDGYGCGYGQNGYDQSGGTAEERQASLDANLQNLKEFTEYANAHGVSTGLWTQSNLSPIASEKQQLVRDFKGEVNTGGITTLKTDVAWVGSGYTFGLNGIKTAYDIVTNDVSTRPNIVTLDGWAGTQRYGAIWTGDQYGGNWEYIRFHIPTYIGQSLSGNPNIGSDMDGIFGGAPVIATRDYQWKTFTTTMLDMDGWGSYVKSPYTHGDPYTGISRMYLKLKAQLMPYIYTSAASAANIEFGKDGDGNGDAGLPMIRAMALADDSEYAASKATQYQYLFGDAFLVAPVYQDTQMDEDGNDVRNDIYLPGDENDIWVDYFTGEEYKGGTILSNFDAPLWKLPLFVRKGSIVPMYEENNNPVAISDDNPDGLDKTKRIVEFYPEGTSEYTLYEDDGMTANATLTNDDEYGTINEISYGEHVETRFTSAVIGDTATLTAEASTGTYEGYDSNRTTKFVVSVNDEPTSVDINGTAGKKVDSLAAFEALGDNESGWFYDEAPEMNKYSGDEEFANTHIINRPKVYVKFAKTDVAKSAQTAVIHGFENSMPTGKDVLVESLAAPVLSAPEEDKVTSSSIEISWDAVEGAIGYDVMVDGMIYSTPAPKLIISDRPFDTEFTFKARTRTAEGYSNWSDDLTVSTLDDPWRNTPTPVEITWTGDLYGDHKADLAFDHIYQSGDGGFHSGGKAINESLTVDLGMVYALDTLEYYPRDDSGNGTVTSMDIAYSMDGVHWTELPTQNWERSADAKVVDLKTTGNGAGRYVRMIPRASVGNFFSASEIKVNKIDGTNGWALGSNLQRAEVSDADYSNMKNYLALENSEPDTSTFQSQIAAHYADLNVNGIYDVYDYSFTMRALDGGTTRTGEPSGNVFFLADKTTVEADDIVTVTMYGNNVANANAVGGVFNFDRTEFEALVPAGTNGVTPTPYLSTMENLSRVKQTYTDGHGTVNIAFANRGDKALYSGSRALATFQLKAKKAGSIASMLDLSQKTMTVGPTGTVIERTYEHGFDESSIPTPEDVVLSQSDLNLTITNEALPTDDGSNVETLIQQKNFDGLFNGSDARDFEYTWVTDGSSWSAETHKVPVTIHMGLKTPTPLRSLRVTAGALSSNGAVHKVSAVFTYADGSKTTFSGGDYDTSNTEYTFTIPDEKKALNVTNIDFTVEESGGTEEGGANPHNGTLTLCEIYVTAPGAVDVASIASADSNKTKLNLGEISQVNAVVSPANALEYFTVESSDPTVASVECIRDGKDVTWYVLGNKAGKANITLKSAADSSKTVTYEVEVGNFLTKDVLTNAIAHAEKAKADSDNIVKEGKLEELNAAIASAQEVLNSGTSQDLIDYAAANLLDTLNTLTQRETKASHLINYDGTEGVKANGGSSQVDFETSGLYEHALDKDENTWWHSDYWHSPSLPQYADYDLGKEYELTDVAFLPRLNNRNGDIFEAEILVGTDADDLTSLGTWTFKNNGRRLDSDGWQTMSFPKVNARYVRVNVKDSGGKYFCSMSEINFYSADAIIDENADVTQLNTAIAKAEGLNADDFGDANWAALQDAIKSGKSMAAEPRSQAAVNAEAIKVNNALLAVRLAPSAEKLNDLPEGE